LPLSNAAALVPCLLVDHALASFPVPCAS